MTLGELTIYLRKKKRDYTDNNTVKRIQDIQKLDSDDKAHVFALMDAFIQSQKAKKVFAH